MTTETAVPVAPDDEEIQIIDRELSESRARLHALRIVKLYELAEVPDGKKNNGQQLTVADVVYSPPIQRRMAANGVEVPRGKSLKDAIVAAELRVGILEDCKADWDARNVVWEAHREKVAREVGGAVADALDELDRMEAGLGEVDG